ncbi:MAG: hypothetical protein WAN23_15040 [Candidatus Acidiferrales bacterium]
MALILKPGQGLIYMKVGTHAQEPLDEIIARKTKEIEDAGFGLWGYGGNTCHPETMVQPFARNFEQRGGIIYLCMHEMNSKHFAEQVRAAEFSVDGTTWEKIDPSINVLGSRFALVVKNLRKEKFDLPLSRTRVALGNSMGSAGSKYISGRVDKACLEIAGGPSKNEETDPESVQIDLVAELISPYAVYVRN